MNSLSWFIYLASVVTHVSFLLTFIGVILLIVGCIFSIMYIVPWDSSLYNTDKQEADREAKIKVGYICKRAVPVGFIMILIATLIPSERAMYMIAGSELGQVAVQSEQGKMILDDITNVIHKKLNDIIGNEVSEEPK